MHTDLSNCSTNTKPTISRLAHKLMIAMSLFIAIGLASAVFARGEERRARIIWFAPTEFAVLDEPAVASAAVANEPVVLEKIEARKGESIELLRPIVTTDKSAAAIVKPTAPAAKLKKSVLMEVTAYCPCTKCCGPQAQGITASGRHVSYNGGKFVAADRKLPFGTKLIIPGYGSEIPVEVIDRGGAIKGDKLDVFFPTHQEALKWGRQKLTVTIED